MQRLMKTLSALAIGAFALTLADPAGAQNKPYVGIAMPTKSSARWIDDGNNMVKVLKERGYTTDLQYAEDDIPNQLSQIENMVTKGAKVLVIAAIDGTTLSDILKGLGYPENKGPFNIELFAGSPDDNNAHVFYDGAMSVLKPLIDGGTLKVPSGQMGVERVATMRWDGAVAQARMDNLLSAYYSDKKLNGVLSPNDDVARGLISSLKSVGYGSGSLKMPIVTGQDAEVPSLKSIIAGEQYSSIFKDTRELAKVAADMVDAMLNGKEVHVNDTKTYNNGVKIVPAYLLKPVAVDKSNWEALLIGSGYYKKSEIN
jgi:putative multiple sugar transport system substrate-binding protein